jgi:ATP-dependent DNA helicase RecG
MIIEQAERFGLAGLHQLRGRVGRGSDKSLCILLHGPRLTETAKARLRIMRETDDGFVLAEEDLKLRGAGEVLGTRQSGMPDFRMSDMQTAGDLLWTATKDAQTILSLDPKLESPRGKALRLLLYLFQKDTEIQTLKAG